ncbi:hypothetical protein UPYG_G00181590 [Umbra pygmaea]|uniref:Tetraspanin n=1 Tax=Umbra pygmaea TaxID=75934 RepID=A0ABD0WV91_UMBPY
MKCSRVNSLKGFVTFVNFICWLCGAFIVGFGEYLLIDSRFVSLIPTVCPLFPANMLIVMGTIVTCVCYLGIMGSLNETRCMLITFFILMFTLIVVELALACTFLVSEKKIETFFEKDLMHSLETYKNSTSERELTIKKDFDAVQHIFRCCGVYGVADWEGDVPLSCCTQEPCDVIHQPLWQEGCHIKFRNWISRNLHITRAGVVSLFVLQFICICFNITIFCHFSLKGYGYK